jgi:hypothetical protein
MSDGSLSTLFILALASLLSLLLASSSAPYPTGESTMYRVYSPVVQDYGAPERALPQSSKPPEGPDPLELRQRSLRKAREAALRLEAEVREICETMDPIH